MKILSYRREKGGGGGGMSEVTYDIINNKDLEL